MIAANELRRGNSVLVTFSKGESGYGNDYIDTIEAIQRSKVLVKSDIHWHPIESIQPIPLTPEILEKAGFVKAIDNQNNECYELKMSNGIDSYGLYLYENSVGLFHKGALIGGGNIYLHQLQNLYYFLVGEELMVSFT